MGGFGMGATWLFWLLIVVGVVLVIVLIARVRSSGRRRGGPTGAGRSAARRLLDERYARGELTSEEYQERVRTLGEDDR